MRILAAIVFVGCTATVPGMEGREQNAMPGSGSGSGGEMQLSLSQYFDEIAAIHCEQAFSCKDSYPTDRGPFEQTWTASVPECEAMLINAWNPKQVETEIAKGRITYDANAAVSCLQGVTFAQSCSDYWVRGIEWAEACYHVVVGSVQSGGACDNNYSCTSFACDQTLHTCQ
jgi:hypothetical protein